MKRLPFATCITNVLWPFSWISCCVLFCFFSLEWPWPLMLHKSPAVFLMNLVGLWCVNPLWSSSWMLLSFDVWISCESWCMNLVNSWISWMLAFDVVWIRCGLSRESCWPLLCMNLLWPFSGILVALNVHEFHVAFLMNLIGLCCCVNHGIINFYNLDDNTSTHLRHPLWHVCLSWSGSHEFEPQSGQTWVRSTSV